MFPEHWEQFKRAARMETLDKVPMAMIIDSPWIPGYLGIHHLDYYLDPEVWFQANLKIMQEYPEIIFFPSWWVEYGMAAEPSVLGAKIKFWQNNTPSEYLSIYNIEDLDRFPEIEVKADGFVPLTLHLMKRHQPRIREAGYIQPVVTARGPLCTAAFCRGTEPFMYDIVDRPEKAHKLLELTTQLTIEWLQAQAEVLGDQVECLFILDDIVGFIGLEHYDEFAHPYLTRINQAFPQDWIKVYHNDANIDPFLERLPDTGFNVLNWGKDLDIGEVRQRIGDRMCLMGNVNPLEVAVRGTPEEVKAETLRVLEAVDGKGIILSVGGGTSPGMPRENMHAMIAGLNEFNGARCV